MIRILLFVLLVYFSVSLPTWIFIIAAILYTLLYTSFELIFLGALLDAYFGLQGTFIPYYTLGLSLIAILSEWFRPRLTWHDESKV